MDAFGRSEQADDVVAIRNKLAQLRSAALVIQSKGLELVAVRQRWADKVASGDYEQADLDKLDTLKEKVADLHQAAKAFLS